MSTKSLESSPKAPDSGTKRKIDVIDDDSSEEAKKIYFVIDTNLMIHKLDVVSKLLKTEINDKLPHIIFPLPVTKELERFNHSTEDSLRIAAIRGNKFIANESAACTRVQVQKLDDYSNWRSLIDIPKKDKDDSIAACALGIQRDFDDAEQVYLATDDRNLRIRCKGYGVETLDSTELTAMMKSKTTRSAAESLKDLKEIHEMASIYSTLSRKQKNIIQSDHRNFARILKDIDDSKFNISKKSLKKRKLNQMSKEDHKAVDELTEAGFPLDSVAQAYYNQDKDKDDAFTALLYKEFGDD